MENENYLRKILFIDWNIIEYKEEKRERERKTIDSDSKWDSQEG